MFQKIYPAPSHDDAGLNKKSSEIEPRNASIKVLGRLVAAVKEILLDILFPPICLGCKKYLTDSKEVICEDCFTGITLHTSLFCPECSRRLAENKKICHPENKFLLGAATDFESEVVKNLIHALKYQSVSRAAEPLGKITTEYLKSLNLDLNDFIFYPIPLSPAHLRQRGFNQAELITQILSTQLNLPAETKNLIRIKNTKPQTKLGKEERRENVRDCFALKNPGIVSEKNIILVDDVFTSGATMSEAVKILKAAGARKIIGLSAAKVN